MQDEELFNSRAQEIHQEHRPTLKKKIEEIDQQLDVLEEELNESIHKKVHNKMQIRKVAQDDIRESIVIDPESIK